MCFDAVSSRNSFLLNLVASVVLLTGSALNKWTALFSLSFSLIQYIEYRIWSCPSQNVVWTSRVEPALWLQTVVQTAGFMWYRNSSSLLPLLLVYIYKFASSVAYPSTDKSYKGKGGHLVWYTDASKGVFGRVSSGLLYLLGLFLPLYLALPETSFLLAYGAATFTYLYNKYNASQEFSSMWCIYGTLYPFVALWMR